MEHDRWSWFAGGVVLGLLIGAGAMSGYSLKKVAEARAETAEAQAEAEVARQEASRQEVAARQAEEKADATIHAFIRRAERSGR